MRINKVCIVSHPYCLLHYMLLSDDDFLRNTYFIVEKISDKLCSKIPNIYKVEVPNSRILKLFLILKLRWLRFKEFSFLNDAIIYGQDNIFITPPLLLDKKMRLLEDGIANYSKIRSKNRKFKWLKSLYGGPLVTGSTFGYSDSIEKIYLTGIAPVPEAIKNKVEIHTFSELWDKCSNSRKNEIMQIFGLTKDLLAQYNGVESVLFTQPLSEDGAIAEETKIRLYKNIIGGLRVAIKPHPREKTDYKNVFTDSVILKSDIPVELLSLAGVRFKNVYTIFSTAALSLPYETRIHFIGTKIHPDLVKRFGEVELRDGQVVNHI